MKKLNFLLFLFLAFSAKGQDSVMLNFQGSVFIDSLNINASNPTIDVLCTSGQYIEFKGDSNGLFNISFLIPNDTHAIRIEARNKISRPNKELRYELQYFPGGQTTFNLTLLNLPIIECWDSFLPRPLTFKMNQSTYISDSTMARIFPFWIEEFQRNAKEIIDQNILQIMGYSGFDEDDKTGKLRAEYIASLFNLDSMIWTIEIIEGGHSDFFYCTHCDGCDYFHLKGKGVQLSDSLISSAPIKKQNDLNELRRIVWLDWKRKTHTNNGHKK